MQGRDVDSDLVVLLLGADDELGKVIFAQPKVQSGCCLKRFPQTSFAFMPSARSTRDSNISKCVELHPSGPDADHQKELHKLNGLSGADYILRVLGFCLECTERFGVVGDHLAHVLFVEVKFRAAVIQGKTIVAAHKNMAYDLKKKLW